ncbi:MAG: hypothetical protein IKN55_10230 [Oscillospiraceae bacterium]|nr:hypothetical protein [Oscillospiraceae bacterium]
MASNKRRHGKVEAKSASPVLRFNGWVIIIITLLCFLACFVLYMSSALSQEDYWEKEIVAGLEEKDGDGNGKGRTARKVTNPVPSSERADDSRIEKCAFIGDFSIFTNYYKTTSGFVYTDAIVGMAESRMRSIGRSLRGASPKAVYIWYQCPSDLEKGAAAMGDLVNNLIDQMATTPIYILTATPSTDPEENQRIDTWNAALFAMADEKGLYYVDVSTTLKANSGTLSATYEDEATMYKTIGDLILTHVAD